MKRILQIFGFILWGFSSFSQYQNLSFLDSPANLGLNHTSVVDIAQDSHGYLWFCTYIGLYRYDGSNVRHYTFNREEAGSLSSNKVISILSTSGGDLIVATLLGSVMKYDFAKDEFIHIEENNTHILRKNLWSLCEDKINRIWCGTEKGIALLDSETLTLNNDDEFLKSNVNSKKINFIGNANTDYVWIGSDNGLFVFHVSQDGEITEMGEFHFDFAGYTSEQNNFISFVTNTGDPGEDKVEVFSKSGIIAFDFTDGFSDPDVELVHSTNADFAFPRAIMPLENNSKEYVLGTNDGVKIYNYDKLSQETFLEDVIVRDMYQDHFGTIWIGTESGLYQMDQNPANFKHYNLRNNYTHKKDLLECISLSPVSGDLWAAWQNGQVTRIRKSEGQFNFESPEHFDILLDNKTILRDRISFMEVADNGMVWLATQGAGVIAFQEKRIDENESIRTQVEINTQNGLIDDYVMSLGNEERGVWIGTWQDGLIYYDKEHNDLKEISINEDNAQVLRKAPISRLIPFESNGKRYLAIGTGGEGVFVQSIDNNPDHHSSTHLSSDSKQFHINNNFITDLHYNNNLLYIASENGYNIYDIEMKKVVPVDSEKNLTHFILQGIHSLEDGTIWVSTNSNGIIKVLSDTTQSQIKHYVRDVYSNYIMSPIVLDGKRMFFSGNDGLTTVHAYAQEEKQEVPIPMINGISVNSHNIDKSNSTPPTSLNYSNLSETDFLEFSYQNKIITFSVNAMHTSDRQPLTYAYMLEGFHDDWVYTSEKEKLIHFTNLPTKKFTFHFKAANSDNLWSDKKSVTFCINPPWWKSNWAYAIYMLAFFLFLWLLFKIILLRQKFQEKIKLTEIEKQKAEELNKLKLDFYTAISHELRTPLTMIMAPIEQLIKTHSLPEENKSLKFIHNNAKKLLRMVNQLLDMRKLESKTTVLHLQKFDYIEFLKEIISSFKPSIHHKNISVTLDTEIESIPIVFDEDEMEKVYNNLFTNAIKYTPPGGHITINVSKLDEDHKLMIQFSDNGKGIREDELPHIFDRYYQTEEHIHEGYGLGLSIAKSVIELHHGNISVTSIFGKGTTFTIVIPTNLVASTPSFSNHVDKIKLSPESDFYTELEENGKVKILIVEDSPDIKEFLQENLKEKYDILLAENGEEGLSIAIQYVPDLIITDIAMPVMDGLEMSKNLKNNQATSHIPVIVLTARTSMNFKLQGYEYGIHAFVTKPFNMDLLHRQIDATLDYLEILKQKYHYRNQDDNNNFFPKLPDISSGDEEFVQSITDYIMTNISNSDLSVEDIANSVQMSQVQFYRKLKAITGITPKRILRELRLQRAKQMLEKTNMNISEVTYAVGFNDLKYFRQKFKDLFGCNPSEVKKANKVSL